jgi:hypothetical protein
MKRLVLLVEGYGDVQAAPSLVGRLIAHLPDDLQGQLFLDNAPMRVGNVHEDTSPLLGLFNQALQSSTFMPGTCEKI